MTKKTILRPALQYACTAIVHDRIVANSYALVALRSQVFSNLCSESAVHLPCHCQTSYICRQRMCFARFKQMFENRGVTSPSYIKPSNSQCLKLISVPSQYLTQIFVCFQKEEALPNCSRVDECASAVCLVL